MKPKTRRIEGAPLDPLSFRRGEDKSTAPIRSSARTAKRAPGFLSPIGEEDHGEGATRPSRSSREETGPRNVLLQFIGPNNQARGA